MALNAALSPLGPMPVRIKFDFFFDRAGVASDISKKKKAGLYKSGSVVMQIARRSIEKRGLARPQLALMKKHPKVALRDLMHLKGVGKKTQEKLLERMKEIRSREPSPSGTPPFTHTGAMRNSIVYAYDQSSQSVVIGGFMQGIPEILNLHEFGGWQTMQAWAWIPGEGRRFSGLIGWWAVGRAPRMNPGQWQPMQPQWKEVFQYPKRPYMRPALFAAIKRNEVVRQFAGNVRIGG